MRIDPAVAELLLDACNVIELQQTEKRASLEKEAELNTALESLIEHLAEKGIVSPEKRAYLEQRVGVDNLEVISSLEKSASRHSKDSSLGGPSAQVETNTMDPIARFALS
jgi:hypothetical protein